VRASYELPRKTPLESFVLFIPATRRSLSPAALCAALRSYLNFTCYRFFLQHAASRTRRWRISKMIFCRGNETPCARARDEFRVSLPPPPPPSPPPPSSSLSLSLSLSLFPDFFRLMRMLRGLISDWREAKYVQNRPSGI